MMIYSCGTITSYCYLHFICTVYSLLLTIAIYYVELIHVFVFYSIKSGKVVIITAGRFAGRKAVVVKSSEEGNDSKKFGHALG